MLAYLQLCLVLAGLWCIIYWFRRDLRTKLFQVGLVGGLAGPISEYWYFQDYWRPPTLFGEATASIEDVLFGFTIVGLGATLFQVILRKESYRDDSRAQRLYALPVIILGTALMMFGLTSLGGFNSIFTSYLTFVCIFVWITIARKDLLVPNILTGLLLAGVGTLTYLVVFDHSFWQQYWLLYGTRHGTIWFEVVPLTEFLWYLLLGMALGGVYEFIWGYSFRDAKIKMENTAR